MFASFVGNGGGRGVNILPIKVIILTLLIFERYEINDIKVEDVWRGISSYIRC